MGALRKFVSASTLGLVDYRSDKERTARYTKQIRDDQRKNAARTTDQSPDDAQRRVETSAVASPSAPSVSDELKKLADLRDSGVLTDEEFADQKAILLGHERPTSESDAT